MSILNIKCKELNSFIIDYKLTYLENYFKEIDKKNSVFLSVIRDIINLDILRKTFNSDHSFE